MDSSGSIADAPSVAATAIGLSLLRRGEGGKAPPAPAEQADAIMAM